MFGKFMFRFFIYYLFVIYYRAIFMLFRPPITGDTNYLASPVLTIKRLLTHASVQSRSHFVDIGCGEGVPAMVARLMLKKHVICSDFQRRFLSFITVLTRCLFISNVTCQTPEQLKIPDNSMVLCVWTSWSKHNRQQLLSTLYQVIPKGAILITVSHGVVHPSFQEVAKIQERFAWGRASVYYYKHA